MNDDTYTDLDVRPNESICPSCRLVYLTSVFSWGVCPDCFAEGFVHHR